MNSVHQTLPPSQGPAMSLGDIYYTLFRHKWKILACGLAGFAAAYYLYRFHPPPYESEAKLFVRYVTEGKTPGPDAKNEKMISPDPRGDAIMNTEVEILTSLDSAAQVADLIGPGEILGVPSAIADRSRAAAVIRNNLVVNVPPKTSVIDVIFEHPNKAIVQPVLAAVISTYLKKHLAIHEAVGMVGDFLTQETDQLRARLAQTEDDLRKARDKAGIISLDEAKKTYGDQIAKIRQDIFDTQAELSEHQAILRELGGASANPLVAAAAVPAVPAIPREVLDEYQSLAIRIDVLRKREQELLTQFTGENAMVKDARAQIAEAEDRRQQLLKDHPDLARTANAVPAQPAATAARDAIDPATEAARVIALQSKIKVLNAQLAEVRSDAAKLDQMEVPIQDLRRRRDLEEANYKYYAASLEEARIDEALGAGRVSNISQIQTPSPPFRDWAKRLKLMLGLAGGGIAAGVAWAFSIEFYFDRSVRRPVDLERLVKVPLFLSIPDLGRKGSRLALGPGRLALPAGTEEGAGSKEQGGNEGQGIRDKGAAGGPYSLTPSIPSGSAPPSPLYPFYETLRDRLMGFFENKGLVHKPKLVAITGLGRESGVTTIAAGLAQCFSETGEGNVLLVDMTVDQGSAQQYYKGKAVHGLEAVLDAKDSAQVQEKLFVVAEGSNSEKLTRIMPRRFNQLVPKMRASDFDYIIFDMPPVSQISITPRLAGYMDMTLMVVESEKTDRDLVQRATSMLEETKANVGVVLNKTKAYVPSRLQKDFLGQPGA